MKQRYYGICLYEKYWLNSKHMSLGFLTGYKKENGGVDDDYRLCDYGELNKIFKDIQDNIDIGASENSHHIFGYPDETKESMLKFVKERLEANGYIHNPEWDYSEETE